MELSKRIEKAREELDTFGTGPSVEDLLDWMIEVRGIEARAASDYHAAAEQMLAHEQGGGDGWWKGFEMLKAAHTKATGHDGHWSSCATHNAPTYPNGPCDCGGNAPRVSPQE